LNVYKEIDMKKKIVLLAIALTAAVGAQLSAAIPPFDTEECTTFCCPDDPRSCFVCCPWQVCPAPACL
jgi:hypothetical protein